METLKNISYFLWYGKRRIVPVADPVVADIATPIEKSLVEVHPVTQEVREYFPRSCD